jgi:AraC-like DNA-binding protein
MKIRAGRREDAAAISRLLVDLAGKYIIGSFNDEGKQNLLSSMTADAIEGFFECGFRYHGSGYSSMLWSAGMNACLESGVNPGYFTVNSSLNAQEVSKHWGFAPTELLHHYLRRTYGVQIPFT